jgi:hypothetical protein
MTEATPVVTEPTTPTPADVLVSAEAAAAAGLPPFTIRGRVPEGLHPSTTPNSTMWWVASGPPGGPFGVLVRVGALDGNGLRIERENGFGVGSEASVDLNGIRWAIATWIDGIEHGRSAHLALWRRAGETVVVVEAYWRAQTAPPPALAALPDRLRSFVDTVIVTP